MFKKPLWMTAQDSDSYAGMGGKNFQNHGKEGFSKYPPPMLPLRCWPAALSVPAIWDNYFERECAWRQCGLSLKCIGRKRLKIQWEPMGTHLTDAGSKSLFLPLCCHGNLEVCKVLLAHSTATFTAPHAWPAAWSQSPRNLTDKGTA